MIIYLLLNSKKILIA